MSEAFVAAAGEVTFLGAFACESALAAALFAFADAAGLRRVAEAFDVARLLASFDIEP